MDKIQLLRKKLVLKARQDVQEKYERRDIHIVRAVNALASLDQVFNLLFEHAREWYSIHFPELEREVRDNEAFLKMMANIGERGGFAREKILKEYSSPEKAPKIEQLAKTSMGVGIAAEDLKQIQGLAGLALGVREERKTLASFVEKEMHVQFPNFSKLAGGLLGAKMLSIAGNGQRLSRMPSSTLQLLGAEKALFQHLKTGSKAPKYGLLFQHPLVQRTRPKHKGKMARTISNKLSLAVKEDYFGKTDISKKLLADLEKRAKSLA